MPSGSSSLIRPLVDHRFLRQQGIPGAPINQLVFSPRENLLAWTDESGSLSRWHNPISSDLPDPHKIIKATAKSITEATEVIDLFDAAPPKDDLDPKDDDAYDLDDNFVIDDLDDGGYRDDANERNVDGPVKEMGMFFLVSERCLDSFSEHYQGSTSFPARVHAYGE